ncbi:class I SAM-dependent methyltransferase [uncultured Muribaculum sp.]|uniref:class I SAM-dependent methyltransferase n=1 Tax=uncultured Muribaculum sp. TaxID=1918613 RepID=UPI0025FC7DE1|nr:class I SAM-dependent methyltransferase [uncultured Muribaculum sp.]
MDEREFFDKLAPTWDANEILSTPEHVRHILSLTGIKRGDRVLDLGTGTGVLLPAIAELTGPDGKITAIDYSTGMLEIARRKFSGLNPRPEFLCMDFENETIDGEYDAIFLYCVYPHLHTPVDTIKWLRAINLSDNGSIIVAFPSDEHFINSVHREKHSESDHLPPASELAEWFRLNGLDAKVVEADDSNYIISISKHPCA